MNKYNALKNEIFMGIMGKVATQISGLEEYDADPKTTTIIMEELGMSFESVNHFLNENQFPSEMNTILKSLVKHIDNRVYEYIKTGKGHAIEEVSELYSNMVSLEEEVETNTEDKKEELEDGISSTIVSLIKKIKDSEPNEIEEITKRIIEISKNDADDKKEEELDEDPYANDDKNDDDDKKDKDDKKDDDKNDDKNDDDDDGNPFDDDSTKDNNNNDDDENPFDEPKDDKKDDDNKKDNDDKKDDKDDPFSDSSSNEEFADLKNLSDLKIHSFGLETLAIKEFNILPSTIENDSIANFAKEITNRLYGDKLVDTKDQYGMESLEFEDAKHHFKNLAKRVLTSAIAGVIMGGLVGMELDTSSLLIPKATLDTL